MSNPILISTADPVLHSSHLEREFQDMHGNKVSVVRSLSNHFVLLDDQPVLYSENFATRLWRLARIPQAAMDECVNLLKNLSTDLPSGKSFEILEINAKPAANCKLAEVFLKNGFERVGDKLVL